MEIERSQPTRFGEARRTPGAHGYVAYFPAPLVRSIELPSSTVNLLADTEASLGELSAVGRLLPNPDLLIRPYMLREAVSSTRIEGTQAEMSEVFDVDAARSDPNPDVEEVVNYVSAMNWGLAQLDRLPLSSRLILEIHRRLMTGVRGRNLSPGEFRTTQNWIGPPGSTIETATFVPPPPTELGDLLSDWEKFANEKPEMPLLVQNALLHVQFESIHPFLDGNGRLGRLLLIFFLVARKRLGTPILYLSSYLEQHRSSYYEALQLAHESGDPFPWIDLFLTAVRTQSADGVIRSQKIIELRDRYRQAAGELGTSNAMDVVDLICENPVINARKVEESLDVSRPTALRLLQRMEEKGVLTEEEKGARGQRRYVAQEMMNAVTGGSGE
ncbi:MAG TPA: Fic family protein [Solirubrobacterales bacterium]|nr:Fic family protein [Solirubrobacterales bacterium]HMX71463.1 Fic family protein [Solirubrobacterales bacterium]HNA43448.1 Fic family protein [Solirubrobacterales bacterium]HNE77946.1 Fic family protein [Solirubrobacterales bacterium]HNH86409.1 Fic family protein [Solirubrobacterales bacterium]